jgi:hypothetical protein
VINIGKPFSGSITGVFSQAGYAGIDLWAFSMGNGSTSLISAMPF